MPIDSQERTRSAAAGWIASADTKATALLTISGALLALLAAVFATNGGVHSLPMLYRVAFVGFCIASIVSIATSAAALWPRTDRATILREKGWPNPELSPTYFGDQATLSCKEFTDLHAKQNENSLARDLGEQTHILCVIAAAKMRFLRISVVAFAAALVFLAALVVAAAVC